ncbi:YxiG family protein [Bacillus toyonensis]|uniref:YxiG family protein n=1 Tax=Bacillus toyonensis TaxID=155322 RepID=UPI003D6539A1
MNSINIQSILDDLWGATISDTHIDLLNDSIKFTLQVIDNGVIKDYKLVFIEVSSFYYVKDDEKRRFAFYDREKVDYLELTTIYYEDPNLSEVKLSLQNEKEWSSKYSTEVNIIIEIWDSILLVEAKQFSLNGEVINLKI